MRVTYGVVLAIVAASLCAGAGWSQPAKKPAAPPKVITVPDPGGLSGIWINARFNPNRDEQQGGPRASPAEQARIGTSALAPPPLTAWAREILEQRQRDAAAGHPFAFTKSRCLPGGTPQSMFPPAALPIQILFSPGQATFLFEEFNQFRIVRMNAKHADDPDPGFFGDSIGHWEGDTLVIDTVAIKEETTLGNEGAPHSDALHVVERLRRTGPDTMEVRVAMDDAKAFTGVWHTVSSLKREASVTRLQEYFCENERNGPDETGRSGVKLPGN
jgi:hypothetical protein